MWTQEALTLLATEWANGLTASQISAKLARDLGIKKTRNACIGVVHRHGLQKRVDPQSSHEVRVNRLRRRREARASIAFVPNKVIRPLKPECLSTERALAKALPMLGGEDGCQFIAGDPAIDATKCGRAKLHGPYCVDHGKLCYEPKVKKAASPNRQARAIHWRDSFGQYVTQL